MAKDDLLDGLQDTDNESVDLLSNMDDTGAPAWVPEEAGEGIQGTLLVKEEQDDEYNPGDTVPVWTVELTSGDKVRVLGFSSVLRREMNGSQAESGDTVAIKFFGEKEILKGKWKGKNYKHFKVAYAKR